MTATGTRGARCGGPVSLACRMLACASAVVAVALVAGAARAPAAQEPLAVVTTTTDLRSLAEAVGGDRVASQPGAAELDPEEYQPKPQDLVRVKQAQAWWCGSGSISISGSTGCWRRPAAASARGAPGYVDASFAHRGARRARR